MKKILLLVLSSVLLFSCAENECHFLTDKEYRNTTHEQFLKTKELTKGRQQQLFSVFNQKLTLEQKEALEFLYAYMPASDLADYDGDFFLKQVNTAFAAKDTFSWGKTIPEDIFRHFVLVYRVNNENLDSARWIFFGELKDRVKNLSMYDAALEVNHWCHEKVAYKPADGRTSAPLATVRTSWGRCGEESTFTVTAMRSVGIPARQCYTPRWAHSDDNHAWVEVWIDGKWYYLGACEPEPELNIAWFTIPAKRAMMVHTNVFGLYNGPEEINFKNDLYTKINLLQNYTNTKTVYAKVLDGNHKPVENATVKFKLYNYSELYPLADFKTDKNGLASLMTGFGDLVVWADKDGKYGYQKVTVKSTDTVTLILNLEQGKEYEEEMDLVPPPIPEKTDEISAEKQAANEKRLAYEDSIRNAYMVTFITQQQAQQLAVKLGLDTAQAWKYLHLAQGNHEQIKLFITNHAKQPELFDFLASLYEKDLRDTRTEVLDDHFSNALKYQGLSAEKYDRKFIVDYIYSPRIQNELIRPWRTFLQRKFDKNFAEKAIKNPMLVVDWVRKNIALNTERNYYNCPMSPQGVFESNFADNHSRNIFFVAVCRSLFIPSRVDLATNKAQYFFNNQWVDVDFETLEALPTVNATLILQNAPKNHVKPEYYPHFTIARFENGDFTTLDYENSKEVEKFPCQLKLIPGYYRLMTGNRADDGGVFAQTSYFNLNANETKSIEIRLRPLSSKTRKVLGTIDMKTQTILENGKTNTFEQLSSGKGLVLAVLNPALEPTRHVMNDIPLLKKEFENWNGGMLFLIPDDKLTKDFKSSNYKNLPKQAVFATDQASSILKQACKTLKIDLKNNFPLVMYITPKGEITFASEGYRIGIGENLIKAIQ